MATAPNKGECAERCEVFVDACGLRGGGKNGQSYFIAKHEAIEVLQRLHGRQRDVAGLDFDGVLGRSDRLLFRNASGLRPRWFNGLWGRLMRDSGLARDSGGQTRTL